ncbi:hypothetical protein [Leucobacter manosquensis]|uniref:Uncharacterized protein n=1 Tax=Leucobacter manosquensis TaxID=2810611 RepID=A0ABS5M388_9MICO|nr:hypothetical protein [Leucobacter manosquensis]MBS3181657.1 hypothetical protein [Leucobacter manosquensis]
MTDEGTGKPRPSRNANLMGLLWSSIGVLLVCTSGIGRELSASPGEARNWTYLREIVFGDPDEPHHREALALTAQTEELVMEVIASNSGITIDRARALARIISAIMFLTMSAAANVSHSVDQIAEEIAVQITPILPD